MSLKTKIDEVRKIIQASKNPLVFFDADCDGTTSFFQLKKAFPQIKKGYPLTKAFEKQDLIIEKIPRKTDLIISFDVPILSPNLLEAIKDKKIIWADHHLVDMKDKLEKYDISYLNPLNYDKLDNRPSSYLAYLVCNKKENLALASFGLVSDFFVLDLLIDFYNEDKGEFNTIFEISNEKREELFKFLNETKCNDENTRTQREDWVKYLTYECNLILFKNLFDLMFKLRTYEDSLKAVSLLENKSFSTIKQEINAEKGFLFEEYSQMREIYKKLIKKALKQKDEKIIFFEYSEESSFTRQIAEELAYRKENAKIICVCFKKEDKDFYSCSFRGKNYDIEKLLKSSIKGLDASGGGHKYSAGCSVKDKDFEEFKKRVLNAK